MPRTVKPHEVNWAAECGKPIPGFKRQGVKCTRPKNHKGSHYATHPPKGG